MKYWEVRVDDKLYEEFTSLEAAEKVALRLRKEYSVLSVVDLLEINAKYVEFGE